MQLKVDHEWNEKCYQLICCKSFWLAKEMQTEKKVFSWM